MMKRFDLRGKVVLAVGGPRCLGGAVWTVFVVFSSFSMLVPRAGAADTRWEESRPAALAALRSELAQEEGRVKVHAAEQPLPLLEDPDAGMRVQADSELQPLERNRTVRLSPVDALVIAGYFLGMLGIGWYYGRRAKTTEDYLLGGRNMKSWMVGLSLFATMLSTAPDICPGSASCWA